MATVAAPPVVGLNTERKFFSSMAIALAVTTLIGFGPTYFFVSIFHGTTPRGVPAEIALTPMGASARPDRQPVDAAAGCADQPGRRQPPRYS